MLARLAKWLEPTTLAAAEAGELEQWLDLCHLTPRSRYTYISSLAAFYRWAVDTGIADADPTDKLLRPRLPRLVPRPIALEHLRSAVAYADPRMKAWLLLAGFQGLRCHEIAMVRRDDVRDHGDTPTLIVSDGKGGHQRVLPLHPDVLAALRPFLHRRGWLFVSQSGNRYPAATVSRYIGRHLRTHNIPGTAHQARHLFATEVYRISRDLRLTQELMGHADPKSTAIYTQLAPGESARVVEQLSFEDPPQ